MHCTVELPDWDLVPSMLFRLVCWKSTSTLTTPAMSRIHRSLISAAAFVAGALSLTTPLIAQAPGSGPVLHVSPYAGVMVFGDYIKGPLGTSVSNAPAPVYGAQVGLSLM